MTKYKKHFFLPFITLLSATALFSQQIKITGKVTDDRTSAPQAFANIVVKGTTIGATTDINGQFELQVDFGEAETIVLMCSYLGYGSQELVVNKNNPLVQFRLAPLAIMAKEVVISASRVSESLMEAPVAIQKINAEKIAGATSGDFYQNLGNLQGIDVISSSFGFKTINSRGFNTTSPVRSVQFVDGMDNQAPGLNFPAGNLIGASDIDLSGVEVISGASSALYGPNAMQGIVNMTTKDPFNHPGLEVMIKGGERNMMNAQFRFAQTIGEKKRFGYKITGDYMKAKDWIPDDTIANRYGKIEANVNLSEILQQKENDLTLSQEDRDKFEKLNVYTDFNPASKPGSITVKAPGYMERDLLINDDARSTKVSAGLYYKLRDSLQLSYLFKYGEATAVYQGTNRYSIRDIRFYQHKLELSGKNFFVKGYTTMENAGNSYDMVFTAVNISKDGIKNYVTNYLKEYLARMDTVTKTFTEDAQKWMSDTAHKYAYAKAQNSWLVPGTPIYDSTFRSIITNPDLKKGSLFVDRSAFHHVEGQYNHPLGAGGSLVVGANYRLYNPQSFGTIFSDTLVNRADTMSDGRTDPGAQYVKLSVYEVGGYLQLVNRLFDDKVKFTSSVRFDKNQNYKLQYSPRFSLVFTQNDHSFRISWQQAFRAPTLQDQFLLLDVGPITLAGNLNGMTNAYTLQSVKDFNAYRDTTTTGSVNAALLKSANVNPIQPENVETIEAGYRGAIARGFYADITGYYSVYTNFIGSMRVYKLLGDAKVDEESGVNAISTHSEKVPTRRLYQVPVNATSKVPAWGITAGLAYYYKSFTFTGNYTYSDLDTMKLSESGIIPGFNTPRHKFNLGVEGKQIWKGLGFGVTHRFIADKYRWQSTFGDGDVPAYSIFDAQISYSLTYIKSVFRVGASNVFNSPVRTAYGSPAIGRLVYVSWSFKL